LGICPAQKTRSIGILLNLSLDGANLMIKYLSKVLYVLTGAKRKLLFLLLIFSFTSVLEALGIGLIGPFIKFASEPELIHKFQPLDWLYQRLGLQESNQFIPILGLAIAIIFCIKSILYFLARSYIFQFSFTQKEELIAKLLNAYLTVPYTFHLSRNTASLIKNTIIETNQFTQACLLQLLNAIASLIIVLSLLVLLAQTDLILLAMILGVLLPIFFIFSLLKKKFSRWGRVKSKAQQEMIRVLNHGLGGIKETRVIGCESYFERQMELQGAKFSRAATLFQSSQQFTRLHFNEIYKISMRC
jgi:ATP-binding cassette, subfamily B, bacterial PglK